MRRLTWRRSQRLLLRWILPFGLALVVLSFVLAGSNIPRDQIRTWRDKRVLIVTAHPDDEVMFFSPTILALVGMGIQIYALCLSIGNADNLGHIRRQELLNSYDRLGVSSEYVKSVDDLRLQDGMTIEWDEKVITEHIRMQVKEKGPFDAIITFDEQGISGHANHLACYRAINVLSQSSTFSPSTSFYTLHTIPVGLKYLSLPLAIARQILPSDHTRRLRFLSSFREYLYAVRAMTAHASQLVWFRYLYITASVYMYNNELIKV